MRTETNGLKRKKVFVEDGVRKEIYLLGLPNIPEPLHGVAPRVCMNRDWWQLTRQRALNLANNRCICCGTPGVPLEVHEEYITDYENRVLEYIRSVAICKKCHSFIHSGRLSALYSKNEITLSAFLLVLEHGLSLCGKYNIQPFITAAEAYSSIPDFMKKPELEEVCKTAWSPPAFEWSGWKMVVEGNEFKSKFETKEEWAKFYNNPE